MLEYLLSLVILKGPIGVKLYLNAIPLLLGLAFFLKNRRLNPIFLPLLLLLVLGVIRSTLLMDYMGILRLGQVFSMIAFASMLKNWINETSLLRLARLMLYLGGVALGIEVMLSDPLPPKLIMGLEIQRYNGPVGESNFSALLFAFTAMIFVLNRNWFHLLASLVCIYFMASRTAIVIISFFVLLLILYKLLKEKLLWPLRIYGLLLCLTPLWVWMAFKLMPLEYLQSMEKLGSGRIFLFVPYVDMGMDQLFGVGYFNGWDRYAEYLEKFMHIDTGRDRQINEQHNIFIQVFSEFGMILYPLWCWQVIKVYWQKNENLIPLIFFSTLLLAFSFLNGLNEFTLYLAFAWIIAANGIGNKYLKEMITT